MLLDKSERIIIRKILNEIDKKKHQLVVQKKQDYLMNCSESY